MTTFLSMYGLGITIIGTIVGLIMFFESRRYPRLQQPRVVIGVVALIMILMIPVASVLANISSPPPPGYGAGVTPTPTSGNSQLTPGSTPGQVTPTQPSTLTPTATNVPPTPTPFPSKNPGVVPSPTPRPTPTARPTPTPTPSPVELLTSPWEVSGSNGAQQASQDITSNVLSGKSMMKITYNLNGFEAFTGDASAIFFNQDGEWKYISLSDYGQNGLNGVQTVYIPLGKFQGNDGATLNLSEGVDSPLGCRFWDGNGSFTVDIYSIVVY